MILLISTVLIIFILNNSLYALHFSILVTLNNVTIIPVWSKSYVDLHCALSTPIEASKKLICSKVFDCWTYVERGRLRTCSWSRLLKTTSGLRWERLVHERCLELEEEADAIVVTDEDIELIDLCQRGRRRCNHSSRRRPLKRMLDH